MSPPDDPPLLARLARGSEWWFTPRWRALLTWVALTGITAAVEVANWNWFLEMTQQPIAYLNSFLATPVPPVFNSIAYGLTFWLLLIWFQPLALRLSLRRGLAWIGLSLVWEILWEYLLNALGNGNWWTLNAINCGTATLQCGVLWGWRSRPWMCLPAQAAASALWMGALLGAFSVPMYFARPVSALPYAALLLYGTRLLRPEERARGAAAK